MSRLSSQSLSRHAISVLKTFRYRAYMGSLMPVDYLSRVVNGKADFPPLHLRHNVAPLRIFEACGAEFMSYLRLLAGLQPNESFLDVGCGCGLMALFLKEYFTEDARYIGLDIHQRSIKWCQQNISRRYPNFQFVHSDLKNLAYNPRGTCRAEEYSFPFEDQTFDVILLKSVFTHMRPPEVDNYLAELSRLLKNTGRCLVTFFLLNEEQARLAAEGRNQFNFRFGEGVWRYVSEQSPENTVAYEEGHVRELLRRHGLKLKAPIYYGTWSGRREGLSLQDLLLLEKQ